MDRIAFIIGETFIFWSPIILAVAAVAAICWFIGLYIGRTRNAIGAFLAVPIAFVLSVVCSRLVHWYCSTDSYVSLEAAMSDFSTGEYALVGAFVGCFLTACLLRLLRVSKSLPEMLDCMVLAGAVGISVGRLACLYNSADRGSILLSNFTELPWAYPVANAATGEAEYRLATFMLQSMITAGIFAVLLLFWLLMKRKGKRGDTFLMFSLLYGAAQAVLDSTRYDKLYLRSNGFVSMVQIVGAVSLVFAVICFSVRMVKSRGWKYWFLGLWLAIAGCLGGAGYMEYYVQRHGDEALFAYTVMSGCLIGAVLLGIVIYILAITGKKKKKTAAKPERLQEKEDTLQEEIWKDISAQPMQSVLQKPTEKAVSEVPAEEKTAQILPAEKTTAQDHSPENRIDPDVALESLSTDELLDHLKDVLEHVE